MLFRGIPESRSLLEMFIPTARGKIDNSIQHQVKTNTFSARQWKAHVVLKRINWNTFVRKKN